MLKINCINYSTLALLLLMVGCRYTSENQCGAPYDMPTYVEVLVTDFNGKPLPNKVVQTAGSASKDIETTDVNGFAKAHFLWLDGCFSDYCEFWSLSASDDYNMVATNVVLSPTSSTPKGNVSVTIKETIKMDSLINISLRLKSERTDIDHVELTVYAAGHKTTDCYTDKATSQPMYHDFGKLYITTPTSRLDTVVSIKAYKTFTFGITARLYTKASTFSYDKNLRISTFEARDTILFNTF